MLEIPAGYRLLDPTEIIEENDLVEYGDPSYQIWRESYRVGRTADFSYRYVRKMSELEQRKIDMSTETITINRQQYKELYEIACGPWRQRMLTSYNMSVVDEITVPKSLIDQAMTEATKEVAAEVRKILKINPKEGTLLLVYIDGEWHFRFADGNGRYYPNQKQSGLPVSNDRPTVPFDLNNLPKALIWSKT